MTDSAPCRASGAAFLKPETHKPPVSSETIVMAVGAGLACAVIAGMLGRRATAADPALMPASASADRLRQGSAVLGASVLVDSAFEHFRGNYANRLMYLPPVLAGATVASGVARSGPRGLRAGAFGAAALVGTVGLGLHAYNILKRPGGLSWNNLFYAAPIAAPGALALAGALGLGSFVVEARAARGDPPPRMRKLGRAMAFGLAGGILATVSEVALLHFRGAYQNSAMYAPIAVPPLAAASLAAVGARPGPRSVKLSRMLLSVTAALGAFGTAFHAYGVQRSMGGWRNWSQNLFSGPPLPAPPSFTGLALAGLGVLRLIEGEGDVAPGEIDGDDRHAHAVRRKAQRDDRQGERARRDLGAHPAPR